MTCLLITATEYFSMRYLLLVLMGNMVHSFPSLGSLSLVPIVCWIYFFKVAINDKVEMVDNPMERKIVLASFEFPKLWRT